MSRFITKYNWNSMDWSNWKEQEVYMLDANPDDLYKEAEQDYMKELTDAKLKHIDEKSAVIHTVLYTITANDGKAENVYGNISVAYEADRVIFSIDSELIQYTDTTVYSRVEYEDPVYLPIQSFVCNPKRSPGTERYYPCGYYETREEAEAELKRICEKEQRSMKPYKWTYNHVIAVSKTKLVNSWAYRADVALAGYPELWHPEQSCHLLSVANAIVEKLISEGKLSREQAMIVEHWWYGFPKWDWSFIKAYATGKETEILLLTEEWQNRQKD